MQLHNDLLLSSKLPATFSPHCALAFLILALYTCADLWQTDHILYVFLHVFEIRGQSCCSQLTTLVYTGDEAEL